MFFKSVKLVSITVLGIEKVKKIAESINMPKNLKEAGVEENKLEYLAKKATECGSISILCDLIKKMLEKFIKEHLIN